MKIELEDMLQNEMSNEFFDWLDECPVMWHLKGSDGYSMEYTFIVTEQDEEFLKWERELIAYQEDYIKHGRAE